MRERFILEVTGNNVTFHVEYPDSYDDALAAGESYLNLKSNTEFKIHKSYVRDDFWEEETPDDVGGDDASNGEGSEDQAPNG